MKMYLVVHCYDIGSSHPEVHAALHETKEGAIKELTEMGVTDIEIGAEYQCGDDGKWTQDAEDCHIEEWVRIDMIM